MRRPALTKKAAAHAQQTAVATAAISPVNGMSCSRGKTAARLQTRAAPHCNF
jgi:hypothetical protein